MRSCDAQIIEINELLSTECAPALCSQGVLGEYLMILCTAAVYGTQ